MSPPPGRRHTARMFLRYYVELDLPTPQAQTLLLDAPITWLPALADQAIQHAEPLLAETGIIVGPPHLHLTRHVTVHLGHPIQFPSKLSLPMTWEPHGWLLPRLDAELELGTLGSHRTQLAINGRYDPPLGTVGRTIDRLALHRIAEATIKDFLDRLASTLQTPQPSLDGQEAMPTR
jgi:hypothetical protein